MSRTWHLVLGVAVLFAIAFVRRIVRWRKAGQVEEEMRQRVEDYNATIDG